MVRVLAPIFGGLLAVALPAAASAQDNDAAELEEARAIVAAAFPPAERDQMMRTLLEQFRSQMEQAIPLDLDAIGDPELTALVTQYRTNLVGLIMPTVQAHLPKILEATAVAYTHEFDLPELKEIRAFTQTPAGQHYFSRSTALIGDPAVAEVNTAYLRDLTAVSSAKQREFTEQLIAYFEAHPEVARKVSEVAGRQ